MNRFVPLAALALATSLAAEPVSAQATTAGPQPAPAATQAAAAAAASPAPAAPPGSSQEELAKQAADPTSPLLAINFRDNWVPSYYQLDDSGNQVQFQPVVPFRAWGVSNILRATVSYETRGPGPRGLSDATIFDLLVFDHSWGRVGFGPVASFRPSGGDGSATALVGPAVGAVLNRGRWTLGGFNQNLFGGDVAVTNLQPVLAYQLGGGWALAAGDAQWSYDWKSGRLMNIPIGILVSKVTQIGGQAMKFSLNPEYNARNLPGLPHWTVRFGISVLAPVK